MVWAKRSRRRGRLKRNSGLVALCFARRGRATAHAVCSLKLHGVATTFALHSARAANGLSPMPRRSVDGAKPNAAGKYPRRTKQSL